MIYENVRLLSCHVNVVLIVLILLYGRCIDLCISEKIANFAVANRQVGRQGRQAGVPKQTQSATNYIITQDI